MKYYAQFYGLSTGYVEGSSPPVFLESNRAPIPACRDRAVIQMDGRMSGWRMECIAADECKKRGFIAYRMMRGASLREVQPNGPVVRVDHLTDLQTASRRSN